MNANAERFIDEYLIDFNGADAARRAGYAKSCAKQRAYALLRRPDVLAALAARHAERRKHFAMGEDEIVARLSHLARSAAGEWQQLRALGMLMRHLGMFAPAAATTRTTRHHGWYRPPPPDPDESETGTAETTTAETPADDPEQDDPEPTEPTEPESQDQDDPEPTEPPAPMPQNPGDPEPTPRRRGHHPAPPPPPRQPFDYNRIIAANNQARARILANRRKHYSDDG